VRGDDRGVVVGLHRSGPDRGLLALALQLGVRGVDTAYNYQGGASHWLLAECAGDLLERLEISTKVGFVPNPGGTVEHSLEPARLNRAVRESALTLGVRPSWCSCTTPSGPWPTCRPLGPWTG
jgi:pyridoxine 4-dehydrogenase